MIAINSQVHASELYILFCYQCHFCMPVYKQSDIDSIIAMPVLTLLCHSKQGTVYIEIIPTLATMSFNEWGGVFWNFNCQ